MYNRLLSFLKKHNVLTHKPTETASHLFTDRVQEVLDRHLHVVDIFLHLSKAYVVINCTILLDKLDPYGVSQACGLNHI